jgi:hypothetical protein
MPTYDAGTTITVEAEVRAYTPFSTVALNDPSGGVNIVIKNPSGGTTVSSTAMTKDSTGKYYYRWQTTTSLAVGDYVVEITADGASADGFNKETIITLE